MTLPPRSRDGARLDKGLGGLSKDLSDMAFFQRNLARAIQRDVAEGLRLLDSAARIHPDAADTLNPIRGHLESAIGALEGFGLRSANRKRAKAGKRKWQRRLRARAAKMQKATGLLTASSADDAVSSGSGSEPAPTPAGSSMASVQSAATAGKQ